MTFVRTRLAWASVLVLVVVGAACGDAGANQDLAAGEGSLAREQAPTTDATPTDTAQSVDEQPAQEAPDVLERAPAAPPLPVTIVDHLGNEVTVESVERIIPLDGTVAEVVFALGLGDKVVATDLSATYPPEADALPQIGYQRALAAEPIAAFEPTVLLATDIAGPPETIDDLRRLGYPLVIVPNEATPEGPAAKIRAVAAALGVVERGEELAAELEAAIARNTVASGDDPPLVAALYVRGQSTQLVLGTSTATHWLIEAAGGVDIADQLGIADPTPIAAEALIAAAPELLLIPAAGLDSVGGIDGLLSLGGLQETPAGKSRSIVTIDDQLLLGNGPRTGDLIAEIAAAIAGLDAP